MVKKIFAWMMMLLLCISLQSCQSDLKMNTIEPENEFEEFLSSVNDNRRAIFDDQSKMDLSPYFHDYSEAAGLLSDEEQEKITRNPRNNPRMLSSEEAADDIDALFTILKASYGAYGYFGGDEVFMPLKSSMQDELKSLSEISRVRLISLIVEKLSSVIVDGHFTVEDEYLITPNDKYFFSVNNIMVIRSEGEYYINDGSKRLKIRDEDKELIKPTIGDDGSIMYCLAALANDADSLPKSLKLIGEDAKDATISLSWEKQTTGDLDKTEAFSVNETETGIPVLTSRAMYANDQKGREQLEQFASLGRANRKDPVFIIDLRGNGGGSDIYCMRWMEGYTGKKANSRRIAAYKKVSPLTIKAAKASSAFDKGTTDYYESIMGKWDGDESKGRWLKNKNTIFVLIDKDVASSGESFVGFLRTMENVVFVGSNTSGCMLVLNQLRYYLPNSGIRIRCGMGIIFNETADNKDGIGYLPDLWVPPGKALELVSKLCGYYALG